MKVEEIINTLDDEGIEYEVDKCLNGTKLVYVKGDCKPFGPDSTFRISEPDPSVKWCMDDCVYVRNNGSTSHQTMDEVIRILKG